MSDLSLSASTTFANALNAISGSTSTSASSDTTTSTTESSTSDLISEFSTIMMIMLLGSMSSQDSSNTSSDSMGMNMNQLMAPLMLTLLEKLTSSQVETATAADVAPTQKSSASDGTSVDKPSGWPAKGPVTQGCHSTHVAIDIGVPIGTKIKSTMSGEVVYSGWNNEGYGNLVIVKNGKYTTYYSHLSKLPVKVGDQVAAGDVIGLSGSTGNSTGPHLHYEVRINGVAVNPVKYM
ncbi:MAG: M23 family metallopeptidase [Anaerolineales bacterium]|nr:M23 family metallopeptidase [Anaerolineales bacterium]